MIVPTVVRLQVLKSEKSMMLVKILDNNYREKELEVILQDSMKPCFYNDEVLFKDQVEWNMGIRKYASKELMELENLYFL